MLHHSAEAVKHCGAHTDDSSARVQEPGFGSVESKRPAPPKNESICHLEVYWVEVHIVEASA